MTVLRWTCLASRQRIVLNQNGKAILKGMWKNILQLILKNSSAEEMQKMMSYINIVIP